MGAVPSTERAATTAEMDTIRARGTRQREALRRTNGGGDALFIGAGGISLAAAVVWFFDDVLPRVVLASARAATSSCSPTRDGMWRTSLRANGAPT